MAKTRKPAYVTASVHGMEAMGANAKEARARAVAKLESLVRDMDGAGPATRVVHGLVLLVWRDLHGWVFKVLQDKAGEVWEGDCAGSGGTCFAERRDALLQGVRAATMRAWSHEVEDDDQFVWDAVGSVLHWPGGGEVHEEVEDWIKWQRGYKRGIDAGLDPEAARDLAGGLRSSTY